LIKGYCINPEEGTVVLTLISWKNIRTEVLRNISEARCQWLSPVILATWETESRRIKVQDK
jgi:hypothetical protein